MRRDRPFDATAPVASVADVVRYVAAARRALQGPLALEIDGPGDPLASPETVLRALALLCEHHPDVATGLVIDGPLAAEYIEALAAFGLQYLLVRQDAATWPTARRLVDGAHHRGEMLDRNEAATLLLEETSRAIHLAGRHGIAGGVRMTLLPTVNAAEVGQIARQAHEAGGECMDVVPHRPVAGAPLAYAGIPTADELATAHRAVAQVFGWDRTGSARRGALAWLRPERLQPVDLDVLDALDVLRTLPDPHRDPVPARILPPRRAQLMAAATSDGVLIDMPLAECHMLRIYAVTEQGIHYVGSRPLPLDPTRHRDAVGDAQTFLQALVGIRAVVATHVPARARTLLEAVGIGAVARGGRIEEVLDRVARGTVPHTEAGAAP